MLWKDYKKAFKTWSEVKRSKSHSFYDSLMVSLKPQSYPTSSSTTKNCPIKLITSTALSVRRANDVRKIDDIKFTFHFSSITSLGAYVFCWNFYMCHWHTAACIIMASLAAQKAIGICEARESEWGRHERGEKLFYSDSMETINYQWYWMIRIKYLPRVRDAIVTRSNKAQQWY